MSRVADCEVVVAGGGPVGCWLAGELKTAGVDVVVLEKLAEHDLNSKALTVLPRTLELFAMRGIAERWLETGVPVPSSHFALMNTRLDFSSLETRYPYVLFFPQAQTAALLEERALALGVPLLREHTVRAGERLDQIAAVELGDPEQFWRIADANRAMEPEEMTDEAGRRLRITLPPGVPGSDESET